MTKFESTVLHPLKFRLFLLAKLPLGLLAGLRPTQLNNVACAVAIRYRYLTQNPFKSLYFGAQCMAAELATGLLAMSLIAQTEKPVSMLVTGMEAKFVKRGLGKVTFRCAEGALLSEKIKETLQTGEGTTCRVHSIGTNKEGQVISEFVFEWSFKLKKAV